MCGILVHTGPWQLNATRELVRRRGPNSWREHAAGPFIFEAAVLMLRAPHTVQPLVLGAATLAYNGEIYNINGNDSRYFLSIIASDPANVHGIEGEWAFALWDGLHLWFGRDRIGRRSLIFGVIGADIVVTSVAAADLAGSTLSPQPATSCPPAPLRECDAGVLYRFDPRSGSLEVIPRGESHPRLSASSIGGMGQSEISHATAELVRLLTQAVAERLVERDILIEDLPDKMLNTSSGTNTNSEVIWPTPVVLFSGGVDCTLLARLMDIVLPPGRHIKLVNVAFENPRAGTFYETPDRILARRSHAELSKLAGGRREFCLVEVDVPYSESQEHAAVVRELMWPATTVMDWSIAVALYFAARGADTAGALISGLGADELFGGYSRHINAARRGREALAAELDLDIGRLGKRNLGRDDRVCAHWGREVRYPFLAETIIEFATNCDVGLKCDGSETKILVRRAAASLGLSKASGEPKRAIQFGARSAKMDKGSGSVRGTDPFLGYT